MPRSACAAGRKRKSAARRRGANCDWRAGSPIGHRPRPAADSSSSPKDSRPARPLYKLPEGAKTAYGRNDQHKDELLKGDFSGRGKVEVSRFKGLGEMMPAQLKETTMDPAKRALLRVNLLGDEKAMTAKVVE